MTKSTIFRFNTLGAARSFSPLWIILGDDELFWVVTPADFERLIRAGYEAA